jgi:hypothetical protein
VLTISGPGKDASSVFKGRSHESSRSGKLQARLVRNPSGQSLILGVC